MDELDQFHENDRLDDLEWPYAPWRRISDPDRLPGEEYIYLLDSGRQVIGREAVPGKIYYAPGTYEPIERFTHYMELLPAPRKEASDD